MHAFVISVIGADVGREEGEREEMMYLAKHRQMKEVVTTDQVARKDRLCDRKLGFR